MSNIINQGVVATEFGNAKDATVDLEVWKNNTPGRVVLQKIAMGGGQIFVTVNGYAKIQLTRQERLLNEQLAFDKKEDVFSNSTLSAVQIYDTAKEAELASDPNVLSESDMVSIVKERKPTVFAGNLEGITSLVTLNRLLEIANEEEVSVKKVNQIEERITAVKPVFRTYDADKGDRDAQGFNKLPLSQ